MSTARATVIPGTPAAAAARASRPAAARDVFASLAAAFKSGGARALTAALADITPASTPGMEVPAYVGELWSGKAYERRYVPLFNHADLTSYEVKGWRWLTKPAVGAYAGAPAQPTSNAFSTEQVTISAERIAGAHGIDRKHRDFGDEEFYRAYFAAMTESYARVSDVTVLGDVVAAATPIVVGAVPAGVSRTMAMVVDGILKVLEGTDTFPTFAVVASGLWRDVALTREQDRLAFLDAAIGLDEGTLAERNFRLIPSASLAAGKVFTAATDAVTVHELGGGSPIRVEAEAISKGEIEEGVFGYYAVNVHDEDGLVVVDDGV